MSNTLCPLSVLVQFSGSDGNRLQDFVLGWSVHIPNMSKDGNLPQIETQFDLKVGPGSTMTGELLWDQSQNKEHEPLIVKLATYLSLNETLEFRGNEQMEKDELAGDERLAHLRTTVEEEHKHALNEKEREILRIKAENEKLKNQSKNIEDKIKHPDEATIKTSAENQELERAKDYYLGKNVEIE